MKKLRKIFATKSHLLQYTCLLFNARNRTRTVHMLIIIIVFLRYERIKFLVIALRNNIEVYAWAPRPYHKFMAFKSFSDLPHKPMIVDLTVEEGSRLKVRNDCARDEASESAKFLYIYYYYINEPAVSLVA